MSVKGWPPDVEQISVEDMGHLGVSTKDRTLYWDGEPVVVKKPLSLTKLQLGFAVVGAVGAGASGLVAILDFVLRLFRCC